MRLSLLSLMIICGLLVSAARTMEEKSGPDSSPLFSLGIDYVIDGRTFVTSGQIIQIWGVNTVETTDPYFIPSKLLLETVLKQAPLECFFKYKEGQDIAVMQCFSDGIDIASMLVSMGLATDNISISGGIYVLDESHAEKHEYGIWKHHRKN